MVGKTILSKSNWTKLNLVKTKFRRSYFHTDFMVLLDTFPKILNICSYVLLLQYDTYVCPTLDFRESDSEMQVFIHDYPSNSWILRVLTSPWLQVECYHSDEAAEPLPWPQELSLCQYPLTASALYANYPVGVPPKISLSTCMSPGWRSGL